MPHVQPLSACPVAIMHPVQALSRPSHSRMPRSKGRPHAHVSTRVVARCVRTCRTSSQGLSRAASYWITCGPGGSATAPSSAASIAKRAPSSIPPTAGASAPAAAAQLHGRPPATISPVAEVGAARRCQPVSAGGYMQHTGCHARQIQSSRTRLPTRRPGACPRGAPRAPEAR